MKFTRRQFLKTCAAAGTFACVGGIQVFVPKRAFAYQQSPTVSKFTAPLPGLGPTGIPVLTPNTTAFPGSDYYEIKVVQFTQQLHQDLGPTKFWGYTDANNPNPRYLGGVIVAQRGKPVRFKVTNNLPSTHILPVDTSSFFFDAQVNPNKTATHLHGGLVPWISDGGPYAWFTPAGGPVGPDWPLSWVPDMGAPIAGSLTYYYPNEQSARLVWYHDHAHDVTRLNAYAGIASAYLITDDFEQGLISAGVLPNIPGYSLGIPLIIQDKGFVSADIATADPTWPGPTAAGSLWYPHKYEGPPNQSLPSMLYTDVVGVCTGVDAPLTGPCGTGRWDRLVNATNPPGPTNVLPDPSVVPEAFFDTIIVNGAPYPTIPVAPRRYRFRLLNGAQARFFNLQLYVKDGTTDGITLVPKGSEVDPNGNPILVPQNAAGPAFIQIGSEGGFMPAPAVFNTGGTNNVNSNLVMGWDLNPTLSNGVTPNPTFGNANRYNLLLGPAERADVIIDFRGFEGANLILYGDAPAPFPGGDIRNDYYPGSPDLTGIGGAPTPAAGQSPDTRLMMQFQVGTSGGVTEPTFAQTIASLQTELPKAFIPGADIQPPPLYTGSIPYTGPVNRNLTLNEDFDEWGRLIQRLGTTAPNGLNNQGITTYARNLADFPTEISQAGTTEVWNIYNLTGDVHPIHFHLVNVQVIQRAKFDLFTPVFAPIAGTETGPDDNEKGWKETVRMNPGEVITVIMKFDLPTVPFPVPFSDRTGVVGSEYVWHCHILEHEEHDMMRPLIVQGPYPLLVSPSSKTIAKKGTAVFKIINGTPPYTITSSNPKFPATPTTVTLNGGTFSVRILPPGVSKKTVLIYTIKDSSSPQQTVTARLTVTSPPVTAT